MNLIWNGTDITTYCNITGCVHRDAAGGRSDSLELQLDRASIWYRWGPEEGDEIEVTADGYTTGIMYLTAAIPKGDQYRVLASSVKPTANKKAWGCFDNISFRALFERLAAECGMTGKIFGMDETIMIPYAMRKGEGCASFMDRIGKAEGFKVKAYNGAFRAIYLPYAESMKPVARLTITGNQDGVSYRRRRNAKHNSLTVLSPWAKATAKDSGAENGNEKVITCLPAMDNTQAGRWARNLLRDINRQAEEMTIDQSLNTSMSALSRVDIDGGTDMDGKWIIEEAEHDLFNKSSSARMFRIIDTIR